HIAALNDRQQIADDTMPRLLKDALQIMDQDDGTEAFLFGLEALINGFEKQ
ncbi:TetR/AcrR family transcriptional regulator C-terminal domain-containing protein, partial [Vibrio parahaemolyticus]